MQKDSTVNLHSDKMKKCIFICKVAVPKRHPSQNTHIHCFLAPAYHWNAIHTSFVHNVHIILLPFCTILNMPYHTLKQYFSNSDFNNLNSNTVSYSITSSAKTYPEAHTIVHKECYKNLYNVQLSTYMCRYIYTHTYINTHTVLCTSL